ncbi:unnamed protein product [Angiostrongylus costaricensis]|uniref:Uncharacterized protein n=1 Tax=Angiostrongylus costaricensis TaxID=334426 RepID=A0A0R3Q0I8_ANGCS|nr:unnamed protein product [Angiostrongylus costaricensis]
MTIDGQEPLVTGFLGMSNVLQEDRQPDGQCSSQRALKKDTMLGGSLERAEPTGQLLNATGKSGGLTGARSSHSTISGTTGDTDDRGVLYSESAKVRSLKFWNTID